MLVLSRRNVRSVLGQPCCQDPSRRHGFAQLSLEDVLMFGVYWIQQIF